MSKKLISSKEYFTQNLHQIISGETIGKLFLYDSSLKFFIAVNNLSEYDGNEILTNEERRSLVEAIPKTDIDIKDYNLISSIARLLEDESFCYEETIKIIRSLSESIPITISLAANYFESHKVKKAAIKDICQPIAANILTLKRQILIALLKRECYKGIGKRFSVKETILMLSNQKLITTAVKQYNKALEGIIIPKELTEHLKVKNIESPSINLSDFAIHQKLNNWESLVFSINYVIDVEMEIFANEVIENTLPLSTD